MPSDAHGTASLRELIATDVAGCLHRRQPVAAQFVNTGSLNRPPIPNGGGGAKVRALKKIHLMRNQRSFIDNWILSTPEMSDDYDVTSAPGRSGSGFEGLRHNPRSDAGELPILDVRSRPLMDLKSDRLALHSAMVMPTLHCTDDVVLETASSVGFGFEDDSSDAMSNGGYSSTELVGDFEQEVDRAQGSGRRLESGMGAQDTRHGLPSTRPERYPYEGRGAGIGVGARAIVGADASIVILSEIPAAPIAPAAVSVEGAHGSSVIDTAQLQEQGLRAHRESPLLTPTQDPVSGTRSAHESLRDLVRPASSIATTDYTTLLTGGYPLGTKHEGRLDMASALAERDVTASADVPASQPFPFTSDDNASVDVLWEEELDKMADRLQEQFVSTKVKGTRHHPNLAYRRRRHGPSALRRISSPVSSAFSARVEPHNEGTEWTGGGIADNDGCSEERVWAGDQPESDASDEQSDDEGFVVHEAGLGEHLQPESEKFAKEQPVSSRPNASSVLSGESSSEAKTPPALVLAPRGASDPGVTPIATLTRTISSRLQGFRLVAPSRLPGVWADTSRVPTTVGALVTSPNPLYIGQTCHVCGLGARGAFCNGCGHAIILVDDI